MYKKEKYYNGLTAKLPKWYAIKVEETSFQVDMKDIWCARYRLAPEEREYFVRIAKKGKMQEYFGDGSVVK